TGSTESSGAVTSSGGTAAGGAGGAGSGGGGSGGGGVSCTSARIALTPQGVSYLALDADHVYWTAEGFTGSVWSTPKSGGVVTKLSTSPPTMNQAAGIAV